MSMYRMNPGTGPRERRAPPSRHLTLEQKLGGGDVCDETNRHRKELLDGTMTLSPPALMFLLSLQTAIWHCAAVAWLLVFNSTATALEHLVMALGNLKLGQIWHIGKLCYADFFWDTAWAWFIMLVAPVVAFPQSFASISFRDAGLGMLLESSLVSLCKQPSNPPAYHRIPWQKVHSKMSKQLLAEAIAPLEFPPLAWPQQDVWSKGKVG
eukprot:s1020_g9.t1